MKPNFKRFLAFVLVMVMVCAYIPAGAFAAEGEAPAQPTATVTEIKKDDLTFAMNFLADAVTDEQLAYYGDWYADFELTVNKKVTFNANGGADGYLSGQYDAWSENWVNVPFEDVTLEADKPLKIMEYASELMGKTGLKYTYGEVYNAVKDFDCGVYFEPAFLKANPDLVVTLELKMYNPKNEAEGYVIGETYIFDTTEIFVAQNVQTGKSYNNVTTALEEAVSGETVQLLTRAKAQIVTVLEDTTLDLNGFELDADYMVSFGNIIDGSAANTGRLNVDAKRFLTQKENAQLPVNTDAGYLFVDVTKFNKAYLADTNRFVFQPFVEAFAHTALMAGKEASGVSVEVEISWKNAADNGTRSQNFVFNDDAVQTYLNSYNADTGKYGKTFMLTLTGAENLQDLQFRVVLRSKTDVAFYSDSVKVSVPEKPEESDKIVETTEEKELTTDDNTGNTALVPEGTKVEEGTALTLTVTEMTEGESNIKVGEGESKKSVDIHVTGVAADNEKPILVTLPAFAEKGLNEGNLKLYHVENGVTNEMTQVASVAEVDAHNEFFYDPATGDVTMALKSFSEIAMVAEDEKAWKGEVKTDWYNDTDIVFEIFNADQLAGLGKLVDEGNTFEGKTIMLCNDINLSGDGKGNGICFKPIGTGYDDAHAFMGTFDGNGCTITGLHQNGWALDEQYGAGKYTYNTTGGGLFAYAKNATFKNLTLDKAYVVMECIDMGTLVGYAYGECHFENIFVSNSIIANYNRYTGGVVGEVGGGVDSEDVDTYSHTFVNVDVDASTTISALWGTFDPGVGGIIGGKYGDATVYMKGCDVACELDVFNDVTSAYRWYSYRRCGMLIGHIEDATRILNGRTEAYADFLTTEDCTVTYGDWVHYHYCEFSHENYPYVRMEPGLFNAACSNPRYGLPKINAAGDKLTVTDPETGAHDAGVHPEGEDHAIEIVFNQLYGGGQGCYGGNYHAEEGNGVTVYGENGEQIPTTTKKFTYKLAHDATLETGKTYTLGDLFAKIEGVDVKDFYVYVSVTPVGENNPARGTFTKVNNADWTQSTIAFSGEGELRITISDYYFCELTTINVTVGEQKPVEVQKFTAKDVTAQDAYTQITLGDLFTTKDDVTIGNVTATVTDPNGTETKITCTSGDEWSAKSIDLTKDGEWTVVINDGDENGKDVTANFTVNKADKFDNKFDKNFLYRVGNQNAVGIGYIFGEKETAVKLSSVNVTIANVAGNASGVYTSNATWTSGTIQFTGAGVVKVTISADGANDLSLNLEVVDAVNTAGAASATANNVVLLKDAGFGSLEVSGGYTLFGNGFTLTCGSDSAALDMGYAFVTMENGTLDNVQIVCPNFSHSILYKSNYAQNDNPTDASGKRYYNIRSAVMVSGNSQILNSRISGGRAAVYATSGNILIDNTTIVGGAAANIHIVSPESFVLRDATLIQVPTQANVNDTSKTVMGFSIVTISDANGNTPAITLEGDLVQYAWAHKGYSDYIPKAGTSLISFDVVSYVLKKTDYVHEITYADGTTADSVNLGICYLPDDRAPSDPTVNDNRTNGAAVPYSKTDINGSAYVYSINNSVPTDASVSELPGEYVPNRYGDIITVTYSDTADGLVPGKSFGTDGWVYELNVDLDKLSGYELDFSKVAMSVNGVAVTDFKVDGNAKPTTPVAVIAGGVTYELTATVNGKDYTARFKVTGTETSKESPSLVAANYEAGLCVASSHGGTWHGAAPALKGIQIRYWSVAEKQYKTIDLADYTPTTKGQLNGTNTTWTYSPANGDFTLTLTGGQVHSGNKVYAMPVVCDGVLYFVAASSKGLVNSGNSARTIPVTYTFKDNNNGDVLTFSHTWSVAENKDAEYSYSDFCNGTLTQLKASSGGGLPCVTPDTLVTLADGTQKRIDEVSYEDQILVWDFYKGEYAAVPSSILINHGRGIYTIATMQFSDGTEVNTINGHGFFHEESNKFIILNEENAADYIGDSFLKQDGDGFSSVTLVDVTIEEREEESWGILTAVHYNCFLEGMLTMTDAEIPGTPGYLMPFEIGEGMKYDEEKMQADIETYGLYTYEDFEGLCTYEQFVGFGLNIFKVSVAKGYITWEDILFLLELHG